MRKFLSFILVLLVFVSVPLQSAVAQTKVKSSKTTTTTTAVAPRFGNTDGITAQQLRNYLEFIASDELEGRDTPSRGLDIAAMYIADHLKTWGIKPAGDNGTYLQKFPLKRNKIDAQNTRFDLNGQNFNYGEDFLAAYNAGSVSGSGIVYASHGWVLKAKNINPYQGIDVRDKIVVVVNSLPKGVTGADLQGKAGVDWSSPALYAQANGAKALITIASFGGLSGWQANRWTQTEKGGLTFGTNPPQVTIPSLIISPRLAAALFQGEKSSGANIFTKAVTEDFVEPFDLKPTKKISLNVGVKTEMTHSQNVVGILEGSDPVLKNEYVAIGAHYDHVGMNPFAAGDDKIWNGADDDGSGTVAVLSMAEAFSKSAQRPKRSILFIWHAGEEKGLWGSEYFTKFPTVDLKNVIAQLNIDMIGRSKKAGYQAPCDINPRPGRKPCNAELSGENEIYVIGSEMMSSELGSITKGVNNSYLNLTYNYKYDDPKDPNRFFFRSDHFNYAQKGIPIAFWFDGEHEDYHGVGDSPDKIDYAKMEKVTRTIFLTLWELAETKSRPKIDKQLPAELTQR